MASEILLSPDVASEIITGIGSIGKWLQALGVVIVVWLLLQITNFLINRKHLKTLSSIKQNLERIETKIDKMQKKKKN